MEIFAKTYYQLYNLPNIGLRFFTVYGPRGRPDMAPYKFLNSIKSETKFKKFGDGTTSRDYTYIDDIVDGIIGALENKSNLTSEIFNLGNSTPITLNEFISTCEEVTGKKAIYDEIEMQKGDVKITLSNTSLLKKITRYNPKTDYKTGIKKFLEWYLFYYKKNNK